ncbi:tyrosine-type recombinase/integrase [Enterococcus raffinosus]|uniref:tyrosine-type recombinase/integrase n=1 Tax=Enterococcus raffinosus TaxID=71452 RepID=UPI001C93B8D5|nr:site-specific integrase [Enterococcus raffinosus]QZO10895.1 site-specific integrase [Enterococcus raffinosus]
MRKGENIYLRKDGRWEGRYPKGRKTDGKIKYGYIYGKSYTEVREKMFPLRVQYSTLQKVNGISCETAEEWVIYWLGQVQQEVKPATFSSYYYKMNKYILPIIKDTPLNELSSEQGKKILKELYGKLSHSTIRVIFRILNKCMNYAKKSGKIFSNPFCSVQLPKTKKKKVNALTRSEQKKIMKVALEEKKGKGIPVLLALHSGMRIGEISALRWKDIDFDSGLIHVSNTYQRISLSYGKKRTQLLFADSKTEASVRVIPMTRSLKKILLNHKKSRNGEFVFSTNGQPSEPRLLTYYFHKIRVKANLPQVHFHQLRHTFATRCLEMEGDIASVSALLGHASTQMTLDTYVNALLEQRYQVIENIERWISK